MVIRMKEEKLLDVLGKIEDEMVLEAAPQGAVLKTVQEKAPDRTRNKGNRKQHTWIKWTAMVACVCILAGVGTLYWAYRNGREMPVDEIANEERDVTSTHTLVGELNQDTAIDFTTTQPQDDGINQNTTATGDKLVLLDDLMQKGFPDWGLTLSAKDVTPSGLTLICTQSGGEPTGELMTGEDYYLTVWKKEHWRMVVPVIENYGWNSLAHWISKDADTEFEIDWKWLYGELEPGTYRLVKEFMDFRKTADYDKAAYWVEFVIE